MWVNTESFYDGSSSRMNLGVAMNVDDLGDHFRVYFAGESGFQAVRKTLGMIEAYNSLVPEKSQPVVPAEPTPKEPFCITGLGLYGTAGGDVVRINHRDPSDDLVPWRSDDGLWFCKDGRRYFGSDDCFNIVKLIKLDEVQP